MIKSVCGVLLLGLVASAAKLPSEIPKCGYEEHECIVERTNWVLRNRPEGIQSIHLLQFDPINVPSMSIVQGGNSPVNIDLQFRNVKFYGLNNATVTKVKGFGKNVEQEIELDLNSPKVALIGPYTINGRVLILPIQGKGDSNITLENMVGKIRLTAKKITKNGKDYLQTDNLKLTFTTTRAWIYLGNLFNGDPQLGPTTNDFLNENWKEIFGELQKVIEDAFSKIIQTLFNNVFAALPYHSVFKDGQ
ncbi:protein takeout-like [Phlebotomus argentipes]|uniref:protein takeout-like n=1 Tax=Phlebotomus argentipes TaxID=94469 RepID=UPI00289369E2|nr:protein takeout-like [Phlebotomus argentipes]